jgi:hypothetical protein
MAWTTSILVIASRTLGSDALLAHMRARADNAPTRFTLVVPPVPGAGEREMQAARERFADHGLDVTVRRGDHDPLLAVHEVWNPARFDEVVVSTLPSHRSRWMASDLPYRVAQATGALVTHVVAEAGRQPVA